MEKLNNSKTKENFIRIVKGSITAIILTFILLFIFSIIVTYTNVKESIISPIIIIITSISILVGSSISSLKIKKNGLLNGALVGIIYILSIYILSSIMGVGFRMDINSILMMFFAIIAGMLGGVVGVNIN